MTALDTELLCIDCGAHQVVTFADCLRTGWPTCCDHTMTLVETSADVDDAAAEVVGPIPKRVAERLSG